MVRYRLTNLGKLVVMLLMVILVICTLFLFKPKSTVSIYGAAKKSDVLNNSLGDKQDVKVNKKAADKPDKMDRQNKLTASSILTIYFDSYSSKIKPVNYSSLDSFVKMMKIYSSDKIIVNGYTSSSVKNDRSPYSMKLSTSRAEAVKSYLIRRGIESKRIVARGMGSTIQNSISEKKNKHNPNRKTDILVKIIK